MLLPVAPPAKPVHLDVMSWLPPLLPSGNTNFASLSEALPAVNSKFPPGYMRATENASLAPIFSTPRILPDFPGHCQSRLTSCRPHPGTSGSCAGAPPAKHQPAADSSRWKSQGRVAKGRVEMGHHAVAVPHRCSPKTTPLPTTEIMKRTIKKVTDLQKACGACHDELLWKLAG